MKRLTLLALGLLAAHAGAQEMSRGEYVARAGDCMACHTASDGAPAG
ncbi:Putative diheme cytochrome c-553 [Cronobacter muytjensii 530]